MFLKYNLFTFIWSIVILLLTMVSGVNNANIESSISDKMVHGFMFSVLCILMTIGFVKQNTFINIKFNAERSAAWICIFFGLLVEIVQYLLPYRTFSWNDVLANAVGTFVGLGIYYVIYKLNTK